MARKHHVASVVSLGDHSKPSDIGLRLPSRTTALDLNPNHLEQVASWESIARVVFANRQQVYHATRFGPQWDS